MDEYKPRETNVRRPDGRICRMTYVSPHFGDGKDIFRTVCGERVMHHRTKSIIANEAVTCLACLAEGIK